MKKILTSTSTTATWPTTPGGVYTIKVAPAGTGTVTVNDHDGDALDADLTAVAVGTVARKTFEAPGDSIVAAGAGLDGTSAHEVTLERVLLR